jgi:hypothetical protein
VEHKERCGAKYQNSISGRYAMKLCTAFTWLRTEMEYFSFILVGAEDSVTRSMFVDDELFSISELSV